MKTHKSHYTTISLLSMIAILFYAAVPVFAEIPSNLIYGVAMNGKAFDIIDSPNAVPVLEPVNTRHPVLRYIGKSHTGRFIAYVSLDVIDDHAPLGRREVTVDELEANPELIPVPSGNLIIEDRSSTKVYQISDPDHYVITAAWAPIKNAIAYTFSDGITTGIAVATIKDGNIEVLRSSGVLADYVNWNGNDIQIYQEGGGTLMTSDGFDVPIYEPTIFRGDSTWKKEIDRRSWSRQIPIPGTPGPEDEKQSFSIDLPNGRRIHGLNLLGVSELHLLDTDQKVLQAVEADAIAAVVTNGMIYKKYTDEGVELNFLSGDGVNRTIMAAATSVTYKLPYGSGTSINITQAGAGYSTQCNVSTHSSTSSMKYAYDMQAASGAYAGIIAPADGTVVYTYRKVTCNALDTSGCADYNKSCSSNGGWGNVVIIQHADGTWSKYSHLRYGSIMPPENKTVSIKRGCQIAMEGHTGNTSGSKNGCGDHLHFQRQCSADLNGTSTSISFSGVSSNPLKCTSYKSDNPGMSCVF